MEFLVLLAIHLLASILGGALVVIVMSSTTAVVPVLVAFAFAVAGVVLADITYLKHRGY